MCCLLSYWIIKRWSIVYEMQALYSICMYVFIDCAYYQQPLWINHLPQPKKSLSLSLLYNYQVKEQQQQRQHQHGHERRQQQQHQQRKRASNRIKTNGNIALLKHIWTSIFLCTLPVTPRVVCITKIILIHTYRFLYLYLHIYFTYFGVHDSDGDQKEKEEKTYLFNI